MKFRFAFEIVLKHKRTVEDAARRDLAQCQVNLAKAESDLKALYDAITDSRQLGHDLQTQASSHSQRQAPRLVQIDHFILGQHLRIGTQKSKVREFKAIYEEAQEVVIAAAKERKIYEKTARTTS